MSDQTQADMIAIDWGTTNCRATLLSAAGLEIETRRAPEGAGSLQTSEFERVFERLVKGWPDVPVWICGMAGSRQGWREAPYLSCPAQLSALGSQISRVKTQSGRTVRIVPGLLYRDAANNCEIMRGEETQIAGLLARREGFSGLAILPGTHCKWVTVKDGHVVRFQTFLTGELYALLASSSILRHSVSGHESGIAADHPAFLQGFTDAISGRLPLVAGLFQIRTQDVLNGVEKDASAARLSGMMIGAEFGAAKSGGWLEDVAEGFIIGGSGLTPLYEKACDLVGLPSQSIYGLDASIQGLWYLAHQQQATAE
jgi:2-dehydro-3-deoxygalactonokinase